MFSRKGKEPGKGKGYSGVNLLEQQLSNLKNDVQLRDSQLHDFLKDMICDNPDLSRSLQGEHPSAETINSHFRQYENLIRHLTVNMIKILNGEKELSSSVKRLNSEIQDQKSNSNLILENSDRSTEGLKSR